MELEFRICNQSLKRTDENKPADLSNEYLTCKFNFLSDDWDAMGKFAIFRCGDKTYREAIIEDECIVPFDALKSDKFILTLYGVNEDVRITTNYIWVNLKRSAFVDKYDESSYFNPDLTEELFDAVEQKVYTSVFNETVTGINESIDSLESNKLDKTTYNTDIPVIREDITELENSKLDNTTFNDTVESINTSIGELDTNKTVTITKQATADTGYFSTYVISQGETALSPKINIPKDYLLKSASLRQCTVKDEPIEGLNVGDWYFDWVLNTKDDTGGETHLYLNASVLTDVYSGDGETIVIDAEGVISVKEGVFASIVHTHMKSDIIDFAHTHIESDITDLRDYALESEVYSKSEVDELLHNLNNKLSVNSTKDVIQVGDTTEIYAHTLKNGMPCIQKKVHFFERLEPSIDLFASQSIIQLDDDIEVYARVKDSDGSLAQNMKVHFFKEDDEELINENIETDNNTNLDNNMEEE